MSEPKYESPNINKAAFNCPHCGAYAHQRWFFVAVNMMDGRPSFFRQEEIAALISGMEETIFSNKFSRQDQDILEFTRWRENINARKPVASGGCNLFQSSHPYEILYNMWVSKCSRCDDFAIWQHDCMIWPQTGDAPSPNSDLPDDVRADYEEASAILDSSPRGAAALLRLGVQKLCKHLGEKGDNLNADIGSLVKKGLNPKIQQALDTIRVIGNHAVHPGQIDLRDDRESARILFDLVNLITDSMISQPKRISEAFDNLPEPDLSRIKSRDASRR